jgi:hypothetical protein
MDAEEMLADVIEQAASARDLRVELRARVERLYVSFQRNPEGKAEELLRLAAASIPTLERFRDDRALARIWLLTGSVQGGHLCRNADWQQAAEQALVHYRRAGFPPAACLGQIAAALYYGPTPVAEAIGRCEELLDGDDRASHANVMRYLGGLVAMAGDPERGRALVERARVMLEDLGQTGAARYSDFVRGDIEQFAGEVAAARDARASLCDYCEQSGDFGALATSAADLADVLCELGEYDEADRWTLVSESRAAADDVGAQFAWRAARAKVLARRGAATEAERLALEARALSDQTDALNKRAAVLTSLADVFATIGEQESADEAARAGVALFESKGNLHAAGRVHGRIA